MTPARRSPSLRSAFRAPLAPALALAAALLTPGAAQADHPAHAPVLSPPKVLEPAIAFWREVFGNYSRDQVLIHAMDYPNKVFTVLDYRSEAASGVDRGTLRRRQRKEAAEAIDRVEDALRRIVANGGKARGLSDEDRAVHALFADFNDPGIYRRLQGRIRSQNGVAERTAEGLQRAGRYLPYMEQVFSEAGLPLELTRLPIVESSYDRSAYSKVAAAGVWQFIPSTARQYMRLDTLVDDRRDPWLSTHAAAEHLSDDFALLKDWPLAVTAYNYGRVGVKRALEAVDGDSLGDLIERFEGRRFGFASRNFYASFVAAVQVDETHNEYFGPLQRAAPMRFETVETRHYIAWQTLQRLSGWDAETFALHNPAYEDLVRQGKLRVPPGHRIRIRPGHRPVFEREYAALDGRHLFSEQRKIFLAHRVGRGETLSHIARRYRTSVSHLQGLNGIRNARSLRAGQTIKVPAPAFHDVAAAAIPGAAPSKAQAPQDTGATRRTVTHRVASGETLSGIARRYGSSVARLQQVNNLRSADRLRAGMTLQIPGASARTYRVAAGESLWHVARRHDIAVADLAAYNGLSGEEIIRIGQELRIPAR